MRKSKKSSTVPFMPVLTVSAWGFLLSLVIILFSFNQIIYAKSSLPIVSKDHQNISPNSINSSFSIASVSQVKVGLPLRLKIAKIKVNAAIDHVGLTATGAMGIPTAPNRAAWFKLGARPGEIGSAVVSGHVNWYNGDYSIFANLSKLKPGDKITVQDDQGKVISFIVRKSVMYGANQDATNIFNSNDDRAHLNLITCGGTWDKRAKQYSKRLVVFTDKE
jgi:hypothetical protein